jgi:hypothetical protein
MSNILIPNRTWVIRSLTWIWAAMVILGFIVAIGYDIIH